MNRYASVAALIAVVGALAACDRTTSPKGGMDATFDLKSVNGTSLPYTKTLGTATLRITSDVLVLHADGSYDDTTTYGIPYAGGMQSSTTIERGTYSISAGTISFKSQSTGGRYSGSLNGTTLTESVNGRTPVYERR
jgi:hypothetical protein